MLTPNPVPLVNNAAAEEAEEDSEAVASVVAEEAEEAHNVVAPVEEVVVAPGSMVQILVEGMAVIRVAGIAQTLVFEAESMRLPLADLGSRQVTTGNSRISAARHRITILPLEAFGET